MSLDPLSFAANRANKSLLNQHLTHLQIGDNIVPAKTLVFGSIAQILSLRIFSFSIGSHISSTHPRFFYHTESIALQFT